MPTRPGALPRAILFDLDDTIISAYGRPDLAWRAVTAELADLLHPLTPHDVADAVNAHARRFWADPERHRQHRQDLSHARRTIVAGALAEFSIPLAPETADRLADRFTTWRNEQMCLFPGALETLDALRKAGVALALITNGDGPGQRRKIDRFDLASRFDHIQIEGEAGFGKPEPQAYHHAVAALNATFGEAWIVGDNLDWEVAAPQRLGLHAIWCDAHGVGLPTDAPAVPDRIIHGLPELLG